MNKRGTLLVSVACAVAMAVMSVVLTACGPVSYEKPIVALFVDTSPSTVAERGPGGSYIQVAEQAAVGTSSELGTLYAATATENTVGNSSWEIQKTFSCGIPDNPKLCRPPARDQAVALEPRLTGLVQEQGAGGSDLLGALQGAGRLFADYPKRNRNLVFLTDGDINTPAFHLYAELPMTPEEMDSRIQDLKSAGSLPDFSNGNEPARVWMGGLGHGLPDPDKATQVISFWQKLIPATGGTLEVADSSPRLTGFP